MRIDVIRDTKILTIECNEDETVQDLKFHLSRLTLIPPTKQVITLHTSQVLEEGLLSDYKLSDGSKIYLSSSDTSFLRDSLPTDLKKLPMKSASLLEASRHQQKSKTSMPQSQSKFTARLVEATRQNNVWKLREALEEHNKIKNLSLQEEDVSEIINKTDHHGWNPIHYACDRGCRSVLAELLYYGANSNAQTLNDWTPLLLACAKGHIELVKMLLAEPMIQVNKITKNRGSAMHIACQRADRELVTLLLENSASSTVENFEGQLPVELTTDSDIIELVSLFSGDKFIARYTQTSIDILPLSFSGQVYWNAPWQINDRLVYLVLDTSCGKFFHYNTRQFFIEKREPDICLSIQDIQNVMERKILEPVPRYMFIVQTESLSLKYYDSQPDITQHWVSFIREAARHFSDSYRNDSRSSSEEEDKILNISQNPNFEENSEDSINIDSFEVLEEIGRGAFGVVKKVVMKSNKNVFAMKIFNKNFLKRHNKLKYAIGECKILKNLSHPSIIRLFYGFQTPKNLYMVMEYCSLGDFDLLLSSVPKLSESEAKFYIAEVILALEYLHSLNIIYRDLKPSNLLFDNSGHVKLSDFGMAKENVTEENRANSFCGSPAYLPPEVFKKKGIWKPADVYMLGVNLFQMITGKLPFVSDDLKTISRQILNEKPKIPSFVTAKAKNLLIATMNRNPDSRPSITSLKAHPFFADINWNALSRKEIPPPYTFEFLNKIPRSEYPFKDENELEF